MVLSSGSHMVAQSGTGHDRVALAEIELCGELMIAASASLEERLSFARIDEVLEVEVRSGVKPQPVIRIPAQPTARHC